MFDGIPVDLFYEIAEDEAPVGYHEDDTPCYAFKGRCPKGGIARTADGAPVLDLSIPENLSSFREYISDITPAPMPKRLDDGRPQAVMKWFEENLLGKTFSFDLPGLGIRRFLVKEGHLFRLACETPKTHPLVRKGYVSGAKDAEDARRMIRAGLVSSGECAGWNESRARSLPLLPKVLTEADAVLRERERPGFLTFIKKFVSEKGSVNTIVFRLNEDGISLGPMSAHAKGLTTSWLKKQDLTAVPSNKVPQTSQARSAASLKTGKVECAEDNSRPDADILPNSSEGVNPVDREKSTMDARAFSSYLADKNCQRAQAHHLQRWESERRDLSFGQ